MGRVVEARTLTLGEEGRIVYLQLHDLLSGVDFTKRAVLRDYIKPLRNSNIRQAMEDLSAMAGTDLEDPSRVGQEMGFPDCYRKSAASPIRSVTTSSGTSGRPPLFSVHASTNC